MKIVLLGAPGSGKGTQAKKLMEKYSIPEISAGEMLRKAVADGSQFGKDAKVYMEKGELVPDSIVLGMIHGRLKKEDCKKGFIITGFPRNDSQAVALDKMLSVISAPVSVAVSIDVPREELVKRMSGRRICKSCGEVFNIYSLPPKIDGICDICKGSFYQRDDDKEETILKRLTVYDAQKTSLIDYYKKKGILKSITGSVTVTAIFQKVCAAVEGK
ncbi:MAG: adenylate kinase [Nitrospirae bacterium]|nr:MAG: adenylate kinase [Nitrospirota bacterium]